MYFSKTDLIKMEKISLTEADAIWSKYYFTGWNSPISIFASLAIVCAVFLLGLSTWLIFSGILLVHSIVALPLASKKMHRHIKKTNKGLTESA